MNEGIAASMRKSGGAHSSRYDTRISFRSFRATSLAQGWRGRMIMAGGTMFAMEKLAELNHARLLRAAVLLLLDAVKAARLAGRAGACRSSFAILRKA